MGAVLLSLVIACGHAHFGHPDEKLTCETTAIQCVHAASGTASEVFKSCQEK